MIAGVMLCKYLTAKYKITAENIVGHSDIAYDKETNLLNRKQDPSHLFDWKFLSHNGIGLALDLESREGEVLFSFGNKDAEILKIKENLKKFGYRVINLNDEFDVEMQSLTRVFNRRFLGIDLDIWTSVSQAALDKIAAL